MRASPIIIRVTICSMNISSIAKNIWNMMIFLPNVSVYENSILIIKNTEMKKQLTKKCLRFHSIASPICSSYSFNSTFAVSSGYSSESSNDISRRPLLRSFSMSLIIIFSCFFEGLYIMASDPLNINTHDMSRNASPSLPLFHITFLDSSIYSPQSDQSFTMLSNQVLSCKYLSMRATSTAGMLAMVVPTAGCLKRTRDMCMKRRAGERL